MSVQLEMDIPWNSKLDLVLLKKLNQGDAIQSVKCLYLELSGAQNTLDFDWRPYDSHYGASPRHYSKFVGEESTSHE